MAMFVQLAGMVMESVGVVVTSGVRVSVGGTYPALVGARVAVMKFDGVGVFTSSTCTEMQDDKRSANKRIDFLNMKLREWKSIQVYT